MTRCDGIDRREFIRVGSLPALGLGLTAALRAQANGASTTPSKSDRNCILVWLDGGPSHLDTFDLKPNAPVEVRGSYKPISTNVAGIEICQHFERLAKQADKFCLVRSMTSDLGVHGLGSHYLLTGYKPSPVLQYPSIGSVVARCQKEKHVLPSYIAMRGGRLQAGNTLGSGYLPGAYNPFVLEGDPSRPDFRVRDLNHSATTSPSSLERRREFLAELDGLSRHIERNPIRQERDAYFEQAYRLILSPEAKQAFDVSKEPGRIRDRYGKRSRVGQSCLLARRLIQAGCRFVTVTDNGWDMHSGIQQAMDRKLPALDKALSALLTDLSDTGLLDETLVLVMGEFGRTPRVNTAAGRDHWPRAFSVLLAGAGVKGGQVVGKTDPRGVQPTERPVSPTDLARTIYALLGVDPDRKFHTSDGRPVHVSPGGNLVTECMA